MPSVHCWDAGTAVARCVNFTDSITIVSLFGCSCLRYIAGMLVYTAVGALRISNDFIFVTKLRA